jgi:soluble lytic murein transglycosylase-like protein
VRLRQLLFATSLVALASPVRAELVFFATGRTMSVTAHRLDGGRLVLSLRGGGEVVCEPSAVERIAPDEVPRPAAVASAVNVQGGPASDPRGTVYQEIIDRVARREGVDARLVRAVIEVESNYRPDARSPRGAMGLMQLMPATARQYALANPYDPVANIEAGIKHLKGLLERFPLAAALAAYNAGTAAVERFGGVPPYAETRTYVARILELVRRL